MQQAVAASITDAVEKSGKIEARPVMRAKTEMEGNDLRSLNEVSQSLERTLNMFRGVVTKTNLS